MKKKRIIILLIIILGIYLFFRNTPFNDISYNLNRFISKVTNTSEYKTIKQDVNKNYSGIGQEKVKNKLEIKMVILLHLQLLKIIKRHILSINKIVMLLGVIINIGVELWLKMVVVLLHLQLF